MDALKIGIANTAAPARDNASKSVKRPEPRPEKEQSKESKAQDPKAMDLEKAMGEIAIRFGFQVELAQDEHTGRSVVKIFSNDGQRLLRQMPPESALKMAAQAREGTLGGLLSSVA